MTRLTHWESLLHNFIESRVKTPFKWGGNDCALFVCDAIQAVTGTDVATAFRGKYTDEAGAMATIKAVTAGATVEDAAVFITAEYKLPECPVLFAKRGDAVLYSGTGGLSLGVVYLDGRNAAIVGTAGLKLVPVHTCKRSWGVG